MNKKDNILIDKLYKELHMDEIEFAQIIAKNMQKKTRDVVLRSMQSKGFAISGFRNLEKVPIDVFTQALRKTIVKGEQGSSVFLQEVRKCGADDSIAEIVKCWYGSGESRKEAENKVRNLNENTLLGEINNKIENKKRVTSEKMTQLDEISQDNKVDEQRNKNKQLQSKIQSLKIQVDKAEKTIESGNKEKNRLEKENQNQRKTIENLNAEILKMKSMLQRISSANTEYEEKIEFYQKVLKRAPKILCFIKAKINEEDILLYNLTVCKSIEASMGLDWNIYSRIWVSENDFSLEEIQRIKGKAIQKVNTARNIRMIIERLR